MAGVAGVPAAAGYGPGRGGGANGTAAGRLADRRRRARGALRHLRSAGAAGGGRRRVRRSVAGEGGGWLGVGGGRYRAPAVAGHVRRAGHRPLHGAAGPRRRVYALFRSPVAGTRQGKTVLVQLRGSVDPETGARYTLKRYESERAAAGDSWRHERITLKPANPDFDPSCSPPRTKAGWTSWPSWWRCSPPPPRRMRAVDYMRLLHYLETEEPIIQPGRIDVLLGQGQTAQVLRNLCLLVFRTPPGTGRRSSD